MLQRLYDRTILLAGHRHAIWWLFVMSIAEASFFPIPVEAMLLPMMFAAPRRCWLFAGVATVGSVVGGIGGYFIGFIAFEAIGSTVLVWFSNIDPLTVSSLTHQQVFFAAVVEPISSFFGSGVTFDEYLGNSDMVGGWVTFAGGFTPIPFKVVTIASGVAHLDLVVFIAASLVSRGLRFAIEAALLTWFGPPIRSFIEKRLALVATVSFVVVVAGFAAVKWFL